MFIYRPQLLFSLGMLLLLLVGSVSVADATLPTIIAPSLDIDLPVHTLAREPITICNDSDAPLSFKFDEEAGLKSLTADPPPPGSVTINFDNLTGACAFTETVALRDEYAVQGVYFSGGAPLDGGAVLGECSGPAPTGISSPNFLAFDYSATLEDGGIPIPPQVITFTQPVDFVKINAGSLTSMDQVSLEAWDIDGHYVWGVSIISTPEMQPLTLVGNDIVRLVIQAWTPTPSFVLDDLVYLPASVGVSWLEEYPPAGVIPVGECAVVDVEYNTSNLATGTYTATLTVVTSDPIQPETPLPVTLGVHAPTAQVTPESLEATLAPGDTTDVPLEVCNSGDWPLDFALVEEAGTGMAHQGPLDGIVGLFKDADPYWTTEVEEFLTAQGIPFEIHGFNDLGLIHYNRFSMIIFSGDQPQKFYDAYEFYADRFEDYVEDGGFLLFVAHDAGNNSGYLWADLPRGVTYQNGIWEALNIIDVPEHPVFEGVPNPFSGDFASSGKFGNLPPDATVLAHGMYWGEPTTIEFPIGRGWFWSFTGALEAAHAWGWEGGPMMENSILWGYSYAPEELPWLLETPDSGTVAANECLTVDIGFDASDLAVGVYTATLEVDSNDPVAPEIDIPVDLTIVEPPQVDFASNSPVMLGELAVFTSTVSGTGPFEFLWEFGDGLTSTLENPTHLYLSAGTFNVTLTVTGTGGTASVTHPFEVVAPEYRAYLPQVLKVYIAP